MELLIQVGVAAARGSNPLNARINRQNLSPGNNHVSLTDSNGAKLDWIALPEEKSVLVLEG